MTSAERVLLADADPILCAWLVVIETGATCIFCPPCAERHWDAEKRGAINYLCPKCVEKLRCCH